MIDIVNFNGIPEEHTDHERITLNGGVIYRRTVCVDGEHTWFEFLPLSRCDCGLHVLEQAERDEVHK